MKYELIALSGKNKENVALILRGNKIKFAEYSVVRNLDLDEPEESDVQWDCTIAYYQNDVYGLQKAIEIYRTKTEENYISRSRLEELATKFKDYNLDEWEDREELNEQKKYLIELLQDDVDITDYELEYFGLNESEG